MNSPSRLSNGNCGNGSYWAFLSHAFPKIIFSEISSILKIFVDQRKRGGRLVLVRSFGLAFSEYEYADYSYCSYYGDYAYDEGVQQGRIVNSYFGLGLTLL